MQSDQLVNQRAGGGRKKSGGEKKARSVVLVKLCSFLVESPGHGAVVVCWNAAMTWVGRIRVLGAGEAEASLESIRFAGAGHNFTAERSLGAWPALAAHAAFAPTASSVARKQSAKP